MDLADIELQETRKLYAEKMSEFDTRWRKLEAGQSEVKQNLIKFNNFVREKQGKVEGGMERMKVELAQQKKRERLQIIRKEMERQQQQQEV